MRTLLRLAAAAALLATPLAAPLRAQRLSLETLTDAEFWKTDDSSRLLARNGGKFAAEARVYGFLALRPAPARPFEIRGLGYLETGDADEEHTEVQLDLLSARWFPSRAVVVEVGKILLPIGEFGPRRFSDVNPLVGAPDMYPVQYPVGASLTGAIRTVDYTAALVTLPAVNERYSPGPSARLRPVLGLGVSAGPAVRVGLGWTHGPYLGKGEQARVPSGASWSDFDETVTTADARVSVGYVEARGEAAWTAYQVPAAARVARGFGWYGEVKATLTPRVFIAARWEHYGYPFIRPVSPAFWIGSVTTQMNGEAGVGYRLSPDALVKVSLRKDHWPVRVQPSGLSYPDGYAVAVQCSVHTDILGLFESPY